MPTPQPKLASTPNSKPTRENTIGIIVLVLAALGVGVGSARYEDREAKREAAISAYIEAYGCVVANMSGRFISSYRCDKLEGGSYLPAAELVRRARQHAGL